MGKLNVVNKYVIVVAGAISAINCNSLKSITFSIYIVRM